MSTSPDARLHFEGVLDKAGKRFFEGFRKRWFTLDGQDLTYFKAPEKTEENYLGTIDFSQVKAVSPIKMVNNGFQILTRNRTYTFSAPTPELLTEWLSVLRQAMQLQSFEKRNSRLSPQDSLDSQYEEVENRKPRSLSSDQSLDEDDTYSCISEPSVRQVPDEYSLVGAVTLPRTARNNGGDAGMYELVQSRPPSKSAPPTYEMVQSPKKRSQENGNGLYDLIPGPYDQQLMTPKGGGDARPSNEKGAVPQMQTGAVEIREDGSDPTALYSSVAKTKRRQNSSVRGLSMISEGEKEEENEAPPSPSPEEKAPPLPPKAALGEAVAVFEIKRFLEETAKEDEENESNLDFTNDDEGDALTAQTGSAFQQLKAFLQKLDCVEGE